MKATGNNRVLEPLWGQFELPVVAASRCTGCGWCVEVCPTECLAMGRHLPRLVRPLDCVSCSLCVVICPADALRMESPETAAPERLSGT